MIITTRGGDAGETSLGSGTRVQKDDLLISLIGSIDECQAHAGAARAISQSGKIYDSLLFIERELHLLMGHITRYEGCECPSIKPIEKIIEEAESKMEMFGFLLPGESQLGAALHICRTITRRAERISIALFRKGEIGEEAYRYLNRLSDCFYALIILSKND
ncbi:MAG: cob(I)yrinic acid a,c-diamide adenosyltransferase [Synergistaceae bacterium]|nr:cob(I)yrinic acid a,c-diamide adenosyltransferase [Synergistaceae bacterium]